MPKLSSYARDLLDRCAKAMTECQMDPKLNLDVIKHDFEAALWAMVPYLAQQAPVHNAERTIRLADPALFAEHMQGRCIYVAVCPASAPDGRITDLDWALALYTLGPYSPGLFWSRPASAEAVAKYRAAAIKSMHRMGEAAQQRVHADKGKAAAAAFLVALYYEVERLAGQTADPACRRQLELCIAAGPAFFELKDAATASDIIDLSFPEFIRRLITR